MTVSHRRAWRAIAVPLLLLLAALALLGWRSAPAHANATQASVMMDDDALLYSGNEKRDKTLRRMAALGVDYVRVTVLWDVVADRAKRGRRRRRHFKPADPSTYPRRNWDRYDELVRSAQADGIGVYFNVTGPGPRWTHRRVHNRRIKDTYMPSATDFYHFVAAVGKRYNGRYVDENGCHCTLPAVRTWSLWNEPNQAGWLSPQYKRVHGHKIPYSPILYRKLWFYGRKALQDTQHGNDAIYVGETAPLGYRGRKSATSPMDPSTFIREFFCVDRHGRPYRGRSAKIRDCGYFRKFGAVKAYAWAHHPYTKKAAPTHKSSIPGSITMANISDLGNLLDQIQATTGLLPPPQTLSTTAPQPSAHMPIILSEFGYETRPPDRYAGVSLRKQAEYINIGDFLAWNNDRVIGNTQFLLEDVKPDKNHTRGTKAYWHTYQSGLFTIRDRPKPSLAAYAFPVFAYRSSPGNYKVWGQLRFIRNGSTPSGTGTLDQTVWIQFQPEGSSTWQNITAVHGGTGPNDMNAVGFFQRDVPVTQPGKIRLHWEGGQLAYNLQYQADSREVKVSP